MIRKGFFVFSLVLSAVVIVPAQGRSITNLDLETYRQQRIKAEADLRENYAKLGFSSPEEMERRSEKSREETAKLAAKLRAERLERDRLAAQREEAARLAVFYSFDRNDPLRADPAPVYFWQNGRRFQRPIKRAQTQEGYFAGGQFWTTGPRTKPQPLWVRPRR